VPAGVTPTRGRVTVPTRELATLGDGLPAPAIQCPAQQSGLQRVSGSVPAALDPARLDRVKQ